MEVRKATEADSLWIAGQMKLFSDFYESQIPMYRDLDHSLNVINGIIKNHILLVSENEHKELTGLIGGLLSQHLFNPDITTLAELWWWVPEEHRGTRAGSMLLKEFVKLGEDQADWIVFTIENNSPVNSDVLTKRGFRKQETSFLREIR